MPKILDFNLYKNRKLKDIRPALEVSILDMCLNKDLRLSIYRKYDNIYISTKEEDEIFKEMTSKIYK